jgi:hypothetical protein
MSFHGYFSDFLQRFLKIVCSSVSFLCALSVTQHALKRCDGGKPICGPCGTNPRDDACEYVDGPELSRKTLLDETLSRLEAQLLWSENHCAPDIVLNAAHQHGGQVYRSTLVLAFSSNYNCDCDLALLNQIHRVCCSHLFLLQNAM